VGGTTVRRGVVGEHDIYVEVGALGGHVAGRGAGEHQAEQPLAVVEVVALRQLDDQLPMLGGEMIGQLEVHGRASLRGHQPSDADTGAQTDCRGPRSIAVVRA